MRMLTAAFVARYAGRLVNIHPSLLPAFPGLHTHRRALAAGVRIHGCTVHFVTAELDGGPIIAQAAVPVRADEPRKRSRRACSRRSTASTRRSCAGSARAVSGWRLTAASRFGRRARRRDRSRPRLWTGMNVESAGAVSAPANQTGKAH